MYVKGWRGEGERDKGFGERMEICFVVCFVLLTWLVDMKE